MAAIARRLGGRLPGLFGVVFFWFLLIFSGLASQTAWASNKPGTAAGQFSVSRTGAATYQIPIDAPPGVNGLKPSLALLYNSQGGNGLLGLGWSLSGLSVISRCPQTIAQDQNIHIPDLSTDDRFCLDGQRLILTTGTTYGSGQTAYHTEVDSFQKVTANGTGTVPTSFTVLDRAGVTRTYSTVVPGANGAKLAWLITSIKDRYNNFITFHYNITAPGPYGQGETNEVSEIDYGYKNTHNVASVLFTYGATSPRMDSYNRYVAGTLVAENYDLLNNITVQDTSGNILRSYALQYQNGSTSQAGKATLLTSVQECGGDGYCYPSSTFTYSGAQAAFDFGTDPGEIQYLDPDQTSFSGGYQVADFDGDGIPDYVYYDPGTTSFWVVFGSTYQVKSWIRATKANGSTAGISLSGAVVANLFGDERQELLVPEFDHPGASPDTPVWKMLVWDPQGGGAHSHGTLVLQDVPTSSGNPLPGCASIEPGCTIDAIAVDIGHKGQSSLLFTSGNKLFYYKNVNGVLNSNAVATNISAWDVSAKMPTMTPVNFSNSGQPEVYVAGNGVVSWSPSQNNFLLTAGDFNDANTSVHFFDADGSGLTSAVMVYGNTWTFFPNTGNGFTFNSNNPNNSNITSAPPGIDSDLTHVAAVDWYGDGRQELVVEANAVFYLYGGDNTGASFVSTGVPAPDGSLTSFDVNGDGNPDILLWWQTTPLSMRVVFNKAQPYLLNEVTDGLGHHTDIGYLPLNDAAHTAYVDSRSTAISGPQAPQETRPYLGPVYLVDAIAVDSVLVAANQQQQLFTYYLYGGSAIDQWGRGFLGFGEVEAINYNNGLYTDDVYRQDFPYTGMVSTSTKYWDSSTTSPAYLGASGVQVSCAFTSTSGDTPICDTSGFPAAVHTSFVHGGVEISDTTDSYDDKYKASAGYPGVYAPYKSKIVENVYDLGTGNPKYETTTTNFTMHLYTSTPIDDDVLPSDVNVATVDSSDATDSELVDTTSDYSQWEPTCPGHPGTVTVQHNVPSTSNSGPKQTQTFAYDGNCFLTSDVKGIIDVNGGNKGTLTKAYTPDVYGNPLTTTVSGDGLSTTAPPRTTTMVYDLSERFPVTTTNALGQSEAATYDVWGHKLTDTDINGNTLTFGYDEYDGQGGLGGLGLKTSESGPQTTINIQWTYAFCGACVTEGVFRVTQTGTDNSSISTQYDSVGRPVFTSHNGFTSGETISQYTKYDLFGRVAAVTAPYKVGPACWDVKNYDVLGRLTKEYQPITNTQCSTSSSPTDSSHERTTATQFTKFQIVTTVSDSSTDTHVGSETTTTNLNVLGKPTSVLDPAGTTSYAYDPWGNPTSVAPPGQVPATMTYDSLGDKLTMQDPDMGAWSYSYDVLGELLTQTDARGNQTKNIYDSLGRIIERDDAEGATHSVYDIAYGAGLGKLAYSYGPNGVWEGLAYDAYGELTDKITVVNGQEYWVTTGYDDQGRVAQVVYPDMTAINVNAAPTAPTNLTVAVDATDLTLFHLNWQDLAQAGQIYHLYRTGSTQTLPTDPTQLLQYEIYSGPISGWIDGTITKSDTYTWWVTACSGSNNNCSPYASASLAVVLPPTVPGTPVPSAQSVQTTNNWTVTWLASTLGSTNTPCPIVYTLQQKLGTGAFTQVGSPITQACGTNPDTVTANVTGGDGTYTYQVKACASGVCSIFSPASAPVTVAIQPGPVGAVQNPVSVTPSSTPVSVQVTWGTASPNGGAGNVTYTVQEYHSVGGLGQPQWHLLGTSTTTSFTHHPTADGVYTYEVSACDNNSTPALCTASPTVGAGTTKVVLPPSPVPGGSAITVPNADTHNTNWSVSWQASQLNGGATALSYVVNEYFGTGTNPINTYNTTTNSLWTNSNTANGTYTYTVQACAMDYSVSSTLQACTLPSSPSSSYTTVIMPPAPVSVNMPAKVNLDGSFNVSWTEHAGGITVTCYWVQRGLYDPETGNIGWFPGGCNDTTTSTTFGSSTADTIYIQVAACDTASICSGFTQSTSSVQGGATPPPVLSGASTTATGTATLNWTSVTGVGHYMFYSRTQSASTGTWSAWNTGTNVGAATSKSVTLTSTQSAGQYYVQGCDSTSCTAASNVKTLTYVAPGAPTMSVPANVNYGTAYTVSWTSPAGATSFKVYSNRKKGTWQGYTLFYSGTATSASDQFGAIVQAIDYYAVACNAAGCGNNSATVEITDNLCGSSCTAGVQKLKRHFDEPPPQLLAIVPELERIPQPLGRVQYHRPAAPRPIAKAPVFVAASRSVQLAEVMPLQPLEAQSLSGLQPTRIDGAASPSGISARQAFFLAHSGTRSIKLRLHPSGNRPLVGSLAATARPAPTIDPRLSMYPPLRKDPRVMAHFVALGGQAPATVMRVDCGDGNANDGCSEPGTSNALMVGYAYKGGYLYKIQKLSSGEDPTPIQVLWQATSESERGQPQQECFDRAIPTGQEDFTDCIGAAFNISNSYDDASGLLSSTTATATLTQAGQDVLSASYSWDGYKNLMHRQVSETVPNGQMSAATVSEYFTYDAENRLCDISATASGVCTSGSMITYNPNGTFLTNGAYTGYNYSNPQVNPPKTQTLASGPFTYMQPHALATVNVGGATRSFTYDEDGNLKSETGDVTRNLYWTSFNKPYEIDAGQVTETFTYGPSRERLMTSVANSTTHDTVTTVYIDGLFEAVTDSASGNTTYRHYFVAGGARVGVESIVANGAGQPTADQLSFYVHDQVGSVIATVTEGIGGTNQTMSVYSYDVWGKARDSGTLAEPAPGSYLAGTQVGQHEGYAGHEDLEDIGIVDMEGRVYDPELGRFLSADPNVQFPLSSQGYDRYAYAGNNPLSLNDPTGYLTGQQIAGIAVAVAIEFYCTVCGAGVDQAFLAGTAEGFVASGGDFQATAMGGLEAMDFAAIGAQFGADPGPGMLLGRSVVEGVVGGEFSEAGGGNFHDGFVGAFASSEASGLIDHIYQGDHSPIAVGIRVGVSAIVGGAISNVTGGDFSAGALSAAVQRLYNDEQEHYSVDDSRGTVTLSDNAKKYLALIANEYSQKTKMDIVVTSGTRTAEAQAEAMYDKLSEKDKLTNYNDQKSVAQIKAAYTNAIKAGEGRDAVIADMATVIKTQMKAGIYISAHLYGDAADVRKIGMTPAQQKIFEAIANEYAFVRAEGIPVHWHLEFDPP